MSWLLDPDYGSRWRRMARKGGSSGGGGTTTNTVQNADPWSGQQPFLKYGFEEAQRVYDSTKPEYFGSPTVAGFNPYQSTAQNMTVNRALSGSPLLQAGQDEAAKTLSGDYLTAGNPYMSGLTSAIDSQIRPMVDSRFTNSNRFGSGAHSGAYTSAMANALAPHMFGAYETERGRMNEMAGLAPSLAQADYSDHAALSAVGLTQQEQAQNELNAQIAKHNFEQNVEANKLSNYMNLIVGNYGGSNTSSSAGPSPGKGGEIGGYGQAAGGIGSLLYGLGSMAGS